MNNVKTAPRFSSFKYGVNNFFKQNQIKIYILIAVAVFGILTGIFTAIKIGLTTSTIHGYSLTIFANGKVFSFDVFFSRMLSHVVMISVLCISSLNVFILPLGHVFIIYRTYLIGFNCTLLIIKYGFTGILTSIIIIIPIQLVVLLVSFILYCILMNRAIEKKKFGHCQGPSFLKIFFIFLLIFTILNLIECLLLILLSANTILII